MAVTRIKNNQITDSTITYQKIAAGTLVGSLFNANLTLNSNVSIAGNLTITGNTTTVNSIDTLVSDSLITLNNGYVGLPTYDVGILFNRALGTLDNYGSVNAALVWSESDGAFIVVLTTETGTTAGTINRAFKANLIAGNITAANSITAEKATITNLNVTNTTVAGLTSTGNIVAASGTNASNFTTGALVVPGGGGVGITGDLYVQGASTFQGNIYAGNIQLSGNINVPVGGTFANTGVFYGNAGGIGALYAGTSTFTPIDHTVLQLTANINNYAQVNFQNYNSGPLASSDIVATANNGDDFYGYVNLGIASSAYNNPYTPDFFPNDSYLIAHGVGTSGNLIIIAELPGTAIRFRIGDYDEANAKATITSTGLRVNTSTTSTSTTSGALIVDGGIGAKGNIHAAAINNTPIGNTTPSTGNFTTANATTINGATATITTVNSTTGNITGLTSTTINAGTTTTATLNVTDGNITNANSTTLVATNFSSGNAQIASGYADNFPIGANTAAPGTFTTLISTNSQTTTEVATNFSTGNAVITGGYIKSVANVFSLDGTIGNINSTQGNVTTLVSTNFSTGNARINGGNIVIAGVSGPGTPGTFVTADHVEGYYGFFGNATIGNLSVDTGNIFLVYYIDAIFANIRSGWADNFKIGPNVAVDGRFSNVYVTNNMSSANINVISANIDTIDVNSQVSHLLFTDDIFAANLVSSNVSITGGFINNTAIGSNSSATLTTLTANSNVTFTSTQQSGTTSTGALVVSGGVGIGANLNVGGNVTVQGNLTVQGDFTTLNVATLDVEDKNITIAKGAINAAAADGAGITVDAANATIIYLNADDSWNFNKIINAPSANISTIGIGTLTTATLNSTNGNITTLVATNFSSGNARIAGGYADNFPIGANVAAPGNFTTGNATSFTSYDATISTINSTNGNIATVTAGIINAVTATSITLNVTNGNITNANSTTLVATNFSSGNARIAGGYADNFPIGANTAAPGNFTTANATSFSGYDATIATINSTTGNIGTLTSSTINAVDETVVTLNVTNGNITNANSTTLVATNFSTGNARIIGGYADNFPIGANTAATGNFTNLDANNFKTASLNVTANVYLSPQSAPAVVTINPLNPGTIDNMSIGATNAANVYASNFRTSTSLWAATTGPVWIRGGTGTSGINNIPIGAVTPSTGVFTTADIQTGNITTLNNFVGNITTLVATNFSSGNVLISGGYISALTNAYITTGLITNFSTANAYIIGGYADNFPIGANTAATGNFTTLTAAALNGAIIGNATPAAGTFTNLTATTSLTSAGNLVLSSGTTTVYTAAAGTANTTGALVITGAGGAAVNGNVYIGQGAVINGNQTAYDTIVRGVSERSLLYIAADSVYDQISIGGNITTANIAQGAKLVVNSTDAMVIPVGTSAQRPGANGFTDVDGMIRYNSTLGELEYYGSGSWKKTGSTFTVIQSRTFANVSGDINGNVDGITTQFTLVADSTTAATLVSINGVIQIPDNAYSVSGNVLTFTEAPAIGDVIDTRIITTTSTVTAVASLNGYNEFLADQDGLHFSTGNVSVGKIENWTIDTNGDLYPVTTANIGYATKRVDYFYVGNINVSGTISGASLSSGSLDDTIIGANIARLGSFTTLFANSTFTTNAEHVTDDIRGKFVAPSSTDAVYGFSTSTYRSAKFVVQLSDEGSGEYQAAEVIMVHNDTTPKIEVYGVTFTGLANLATFSSNISGGIAYLNASSAGANLKIKVSPTLMKK